MIRTVEQTAIILASLLQRSKERRVRIATKTVRLASRRTLLRVAFMAPLIETLAQRWGIAMFELDTGGYGLIKMSSVEAAKTATMKRMFTAADRKRLRDNEDDFFDELAVNLEQEEEFIEDEEDE